MRVTYTWWRGLVTSALVSACASSVGTPLPRGAPRLAAGSTPEPVRYEVVLPGLRSIVRDRVARLLADSLFEVSLVDPSAITGYSLARLVKIRVDFTQVGRDSMRAALTGETYLGDTTRRDSISGLPERWRLLTASDPQANLLRGFARTLHARGEAEVRLESALAENERPQVLDTAPGPAFSSKEPVTGSTTDPEVVQLLAGTPVHRSVDVCRSAVIPNGWLVLYWRLDPSRCTGFLASGYRGEPNVMRLEREW
jgi:hypothetical protein